MWPKWLFSLLVFGLVRGAALPQEPSAKSSLAQTPAPVTINFLVLDHQGDPIRGIEQSDIAILDGGKPPQAIVSFRSAKELPLRLGILVPSSRGRWWQPESEYWADNSSIGHWVPSDASDSVTKSAIEFMSRVLTGPDDKGFIVTSSSISHGIRFMSRDEILTLTPDSLLSNKPLKAGDETFNYDAIGLMCAAMQNDSIFPARRILVLAVGEGTKFSFGEAKTAVFRSSVTIFGIGNPSFTGGSGGYYWEAVMDCPQYIGYFCNGSKSDFATPFNNIKTQMDYMYSVTYIPAEAADPKHLQKIQVKVVTNKDWYARAPLGYYATALKR